MKIKLKQNLLLLIFVMMVIGSVTAYAYQIYSFTLQIDSPIAYSTPNYKDSDTVVAYVQQTGSSPGTFYVTYTIMNAGKNVELTVPKQYLGSDYNTRQVSYYLQNKAYRGNTYLRGVYDGNSIHTVAGNWDTDI